MRVRLFSAVMLFFIFITGLAFAEDAKKKADQKGQSGAKLPSVFVPAESYEFPQVVEGVEVLHDYIVQNKGNADLNIKKVKPG